MLEVHPIFSFKNKHIVENTKSTQPGSFRFIGNRKSLKYVTAIALLNVFDASTFVLSTTKNRISFYIRYCDVCTGWANRFWFCSLKVYSAVCVAVFMKLRKPDLTLARKMAAQWLTCMVVSDSLAKKEPNNRDHTKETRYSHSYFFWRCVAQSVPCYCKSSFLFVTKLEYERLAVNHLGSTGPPQMPEDFRTANQAQENRICKEQKYYLVKAALLLKRSVYKNIHGAKLVVFEILFYVKTSHTVSFHCVNFRSEVVCYTFYQESRHYLCKQKGFQPYPDDSVVDQTH